jgi:hypothetical protein
MRFTFNARQSQPKLRLVGAYRTTLTYSAICLPFGRINLSNTVSLRGFHASKRRRQYLRIQAETKKQNTVSPTQAR